MPDRSSVVTIRDCPFCESKAELHHSRDDEASWIECTGCGATSGVNTLLSVVDVVANWNTRIKDEADVARLLADVEVMLDTPEIEDFVHAIQVEMPHQIQRWGTSHDAGKTISDWLRVVNHLVAKAGQADWDRNGEKLKHHIITAAAVLGNMHAAIKNAEASNA